MSKNEVTAKKVFHDWFQSLFKYSFAEMSWSAIGVAIVGRFILILFVFYGGWNFFVSVLVNSNPLSKEPEIHSAAVFTTVSPTMLNGTGGAEYFVFTSSWKPSDPEAYYTRENQIFLAIDSERVRFDYSQPVPFGQTFNYIFSLGGKTGGNLPIGRLGVYEVTIGDGDYQTIVVRDTHQNKVLNKISNEMRTKLKRELQRDVTVEIVIREKLISHQKFELTINLLGQDFVYELDLPEKWKEKDDVYFGMLDYGKGTNETSVYWTEPEVAQVINN